MSWPTVSVVLPTYCRPPALKRALDALARQHSPGATWDVIVVDNDPAGSAAQIVDRASDAVAVPVHYVTESSVGAGNARNAGIRAATGQVIAFCDDDVEPRADWLAELVGPILAERYEGTAGRVELDWGGPAPHWLPPALASYLAEHDPYDVETELGPGDYLLTANAALRADLLRGIGGFDPVLGPRGGVPMVNDDVDLYRRFRAAGGRVLYRPSAVVVHELPVARLQRRYLMRRLYGQGRSDFLLERRELLQGSTRGLKAGVTQLVEDLGSHRRAGSWQATMTQVACDGARFAGFIRESAASFGPRWPGRHADAPRPMPPLGEA